eukprot:TRINITY_DN995_c0_g1::TRINITY_DN995_c0_g1_i1::g.15944::m.15944 TRINITY_DN995_c0_g1::TRINITY_DN995_c0_g1_i1::g.15944  ORF type:complete len:392 (+),score=104.01 TRINITY_DN995_c0_g1_i1:37-1176(+)
MSSTFSRFARSTAVIFANRARTSRFVVPAAIAGTCLAAQLESPAIDDSVFVRNHFTTAKSTDGLPEWVPRAGETQVTSCQAKCEKKECEKKQECQKKECGMKKECEKTECKKSECEKKTCEKAQSCPKKCEKKEECHLKAPCGKAATESKAAAPAEEDPFADFMALFQGEAAADTPKTAPCPHAHKKHTPSTSTSTPQDDGMAEIWAALGIEPESAPVSSQSHSHAAHAHEEESSTISSEVDLSASEADPLLAIMSVLMGDVKPEEIEHAPEKHDNAHQAQPDEFSQWLASITGEEAPAHPAVAAKPAEAPKPAPKHDHAHKTESEDDFLSLFLGGAEEGHGSDSHGEHAAGDHDARPHKLVVSSGHGGAKVTLKIARA